MKKLGLLLAVLLLITYFSDAQRWKRYRYELVGGIGTSNYLGDLGGGAGDGKHFFSVQDMDILTSRYALMGGLRYRITEELSARTVIHFGRVDGDDAYAQNDGRKTRNLHFKSVLWEFATYFEYAILSETMGSRYSLRKRKYSAYVFVGIGAFYFNPKAKMDGRWYDLQPLATEGQGQEGMADIYTRFAAAFPVGLSFNYSIDKRLSVGADFGFRYTTTDYLDDVSDKYYDWSQYNGSAEQLYFSDRHTEIDGKPAEYRFDGYDENSPAPPRGNPEYNDSYMFFIIKVNYKLKTSRNGLPKFY